MLMLGRIAAAIISGALLAQSYGLHPFWALAWIAPIPVLIAAIGASRLGAFLYGALAGALSMALMVAYFLRIGGPAPVIVITLVKALVWGAMAFAVRGAARHIPSRAAVFVFPALMAGIETLIAATSPHGSAGALAYSQMDFLPAIQVAALGGASAITFVLCLFASVVAFLIAKRAVIAALAPVLIVAAALGYGVTRERLEAPQHLQEARLLNVAALAGDDFDHDAADWRPTWESYLFETERAAESNPNFVLLPEKIVTFAEGDAPEALAALSAIATQHNIAIVVGATKHLGERAYNRAYLVTADGVRSYDKHHMIPGLESDLTPGDAILITDIDGLRVGVAICKDFDFPNLLRRYAHERVDVMLAPAWDFQVDAWLHARMAVLRGVEGGFTLVRSAREGVMTVTDPFGRVLAEATSGGDIAGLAASLAWPSHIPTLYTRIGDTFGWGCMLIALALIGWTIAARRRAGQG